jgi:hypothetical protein
VAAVWGLLDDLGVAGLIDQHAPAVPGLPLTPGANWRWLCSTGWSSRVPRAGSATGGRPPAADRFTKIGVSALDHRRFWDAMRAVPGDALARIGHAVAVKVCEAFGLDTSSVALDMTNFAIFIATADSGLRRKISTRGLSVPRICGQVPSCVCGQAFVTNVAIGTRGSLSADGRAVDDSWTRSTIIPFRCPRHLPLGRSGPVTSGWP